MATTQSITIEPSLKIDTRSLNEALVQGAEPNTVGRVLAQLEILLQVAPLLNVREEENPGLFEALSRLHAKSAAYVSGGTDSLRFTQAYNDTIEEIAYKKKGSFNAD